MLKAIVEDFGNGGTIDGDLVVSGDLTVSGGGILSFDEILEGTQVIDVTDPKAFLVRKNADGGDVFVVDSTNSRVGIGISAPDTNLHIYENAGSNTEIKVENINASGSAIFKAVSHTGRWAQIQFGDTADEDRARVAYDNDNDKMLFKVNGSADASLVIDSSGNVGIGTASIDANTILQVSGTNDIKLTLEDTEGNSTASYMTFQDTGGMTALIGHNSTNDQFMVANRTASGNLLFQTGGSNTRMTIDSSGNVGIGGTPSNRLYVTTSDSGQWAAVIENTHSTSGYGVKIKAGDSNTESVLLLEDKDATDLFEVNSAGQTYMKGNVGIGVTPSGWDTYGKVLQIGEQFNIMANDDGQDTYITANRYYNGGWKWQNTDQGASQIFMSAGEIKFSTVGTTGHSAGDAQTIVDRMTIDSSGNVGIGTDVPSTLLHLASSSGITQTIDTSSGTSGVGILRFVSDRDSDGQKISGIDFDNNTINSAANIVVRRGSTDGKGDFAILTSQSERFRIDEDGNVGIGVDAPAVQLHSQSSAVNYIRVENTSSDAAGIQFYSGHGNWAIVNSFSVADSLEFVDISDSNAKRMILDANSRISLSNNDAGTGNTIFGNTAGDPDGAGDYNTFIGKLAGGAGTQTDDADYNVGVGYYALAELTQGTKNTAVGVGALEDVTIGDHNTAIGFQALQDLGTAQSDDNVAIGYQAMGGVIGTEQVDDCVAIGSGALSGALDSTDGTDEASGTVAIGKSALTALTSGAGNTAVGYQSLATEDDGDFNTAVGYQALKAQTGTSGVVGNTAVGYQSCATGVNDLTTGVKNTVIGASSESGNAAADNRSVIGYGATGNGDNSVVLGNSDVTDVYMAEDSGATVHCGGISMLAGDALFGAAASNGTKYIKIHGSTHGQIDVGGNGTALDTRMSLINDNGSVGSIKTTGSATQFNTSSDYRLKENEVLISDGLARLEKLKPYRFNFKADKDKTVDGFFAHEVQEVVPEAISGEKDAVDSDGNIDAQGIDHSKLVPLLVKAVQELTAKVEALEAK